MNEHAAVVCRQPVELILNSHFGGPAIRRIRDAIPHVARLLHRPVLEHMSALAGTIFQHPSPLPNLRW